MRGPKNMIVVKHGVLEGIPWAVCRAPRPGVNGYIRLPEGHPWAVSTWVEMWSLDIECPGGITYMPDKDNWIGFDTLHYGDYWSPAEIDRIGLIYEERSWRHHYTPDEPDATFWSLGQVIAATKHLARAAAEVRSY